MDNSAADFTAEVRPEWIDLNNHMTFWAYLKLFEDAAASYFTRNGIIEPAGAEPRELRTSQHHVKFFKETFVGDPLKFEVQILGYGEKHIHLFQRMRSSTNGQLLAAQESVKKNLGGSTRLPFAERECAFPMATLQRLALLAKEHEKLPRPAEVGAAIKAPQPR